MNTLGSNNEIVQNKLIIMYIMHRLNMPASNGNITELVLKTRLMNYFMFQQCFSELYKGGFIELFENKTAEQREETAASKNQKGGPGLFVLTETGEKTLDYFLNLIPEGIKKQLDKTALSARKEIREETLVKADYVPESEDKYMVICKIGEKGFPLIELKVAVGTKKDARAVCENWKNNSSAIYAEIIESLTKPRN